MNFNFPVSEKQAPCIALPVSKAAEVQQRNQLIKTSFVCFGIVILASVLLFGSLAAIAKIILKIN